MFYTQSCQTAVFYMAAALVVQQDNHVGSALFAGTISAGHLTIGFVFAGLLVRSLPCTSLIGSLSHSRRPALI